MKIPCWVCDACKCENAPECIIIDNFNGSTLAPRRCVLDITGLTKWRKAMVEINTKTTIEVGKIEEE